MRSTLVAAACAFALLAACNWKAGQANSAQGNISQDNRPPATAKASEVTNADATNGMVMLAVPVSKDQASQIMHARHEGMEAMGDATKALHRALSGTPDLASVRTNASKIAQLSEQASTWFPAGTGPNVGKTRAKPEIWQNSEDFASRLRALQTAARALETASRSNDVAAMNARFADLGATCKACHDKYRAEENH
jgi:cytochrome c556